MVEQYQSSGNLFYLDLATLILKKGETLGVLEDDELLLQIIKQLIHAVEKDCSNYKLIVLFDFINLIIERRTMAPFAEYVKHPLYIIVKRFPLLVFSSNKCSN